MDQPLLFSSRGTTSYCEPTFVFLQLASLPIEHKSQITQDLIRALLALSSPNPGHIPAVH
jgi:hypothetical protein